MTTVVNPAGGYAKPSTPQSGADEVELRHQDEPHSPHSVANDADLVRQDDEILTISAMYPECFAQEDPAVEPREFEISFAGCALQVTLPAGYPSCEPPQICIIHRDHSASKELFAAWQGAAKEATTFLCTDIFVEGEECLFAALEDIGHRLQNATDAAADLSQKSDVPTNSASVPPTQKDVSDPSVRDEAFVCLHHLDQGKDPKEKPLCKLLQQMGLDAVVFYGRPCLLHIQGAPEDVDSFVGQCKSRKITISISLAQRSKGPTIEAGVTAVPAKKGALDGAALKAHLEKRGLGETSYSLISNNVPKGCC
jgi:hypothetical protein